MSKLILLYDNLADAATLSGGSWAIPLTRMQTPQPSNRCRSTNLLAASTKFDVALSKNKTFKAIVVGPGNFSLGMTYRIRGYSDAGFTTLTYDSGVRESGIPTVPTLSLEWEDDNFWMGTQPLVDPDHVGFPIIHIPTVLANGRYWRIEIFDAANPDGYVEIGRLFMGSTFSPIYNFSKEGNQFTLKPHTSVQQALSGSRYYNRRASERSFRFAFPMLPTAQVWQDVYTLNVISGLDKQVFVIPDPDDFDHMLKRSFLGNLNELSGIQLFSVGLASAAFDVTEAL